MFLADQGRDALIIKNIVLLKKFPAIGPPSSIGEVFLGPFYYYVVAPFLALFRLQPVGLAIGVAVLSLIGLWFCYQIIVKTTSQQVGIIFLFFTAFSYRLIDSSRFSWNPNLLPYFSFITLSLFVYALQQKKQKEQNIFALLTGLFFGLSFQLHHLAALLSVPMVILFSVSLAKKKNLKLLYLPLLSICSFLLVSSPLILFDIKNNFLNTRNLIAALTKQNVVSSGPFLNQFAETIDAFISHSLNTRFSLIVGLLFLFSLCCTIVWSLKKKPNTYVLAHLTLIISYLLLFTKIQSPRYPHYFGSLYLSLFFLLAYLLVKIGSLFFRKQSIRLIFISVFCFGFIFLQAKNYYFLFQEGTFQDKLPRQIGAFIAKDAGKKPLNLATYPIEFTSEDCYQYFIELNGGTVAQRRKQEVTDQMYVLCNSKQCPILNSQSWNITMFGKAKISAFWTIESVQIYKLTHKQ